MMASGAAAQDASSDRADLDSAAGRALFQNTPLALAVEPAPSPLPVARRSPPERRIGADGRRSVRIVYPGPFGR